MRGHALDGAALEQIRGILQRALDPLPTSRSDRVRSNFARALRGLKLTDLQPRQTQHALSRRVVEGQHAWKIGL